MTDEADFRYDVYATRTLVDAYYAVLRSGREAFDPARLRDVLAVDLDFEGPLAGRVRGAEPFIKGVSGFVETVQELTMLHLVAESADGHAHAAAMYDARMPGGTIRFAEFFSLVNGRIASLRLLYNGPDYLAAGGR